MDTREMNDFAKSLNSRFHVMAKPIGPLLINTGKND